MEVEQPTGNAEDDVVPGIPVQLGTHAAVYRFNTTSDQ
jgi:hypothetical protein